MMRFPKSEDLGMAKSPDGKFYTLHFFGENEGVAVIAGPSQPSNAFPVTLVEMPEVHRENAVDATDAMARLVAWIGARGWTAQ